MFGESLELRGGSPDKAQPHPGKRALNAPPHTDLLPEGGGETNRTEFDEESGRRKAKTQP
ncbi:hypothetical protein PHDIMM138B_24460 [Phytobacter diazotrophicus]